MTNHRSIFLSWLQRRWPGYRSFILISWLKLRWPIIVLFYYPGQKEDDQSSFYFTIMVKTKMTNHRSILLSWLQRRWPGYHSFILLSWLKLRWPIIVLFYYPGQKEDYQSSFYFTILVKTKMTNHRSILLSWLQRRWPGHHSFISLSCLKLRWPIIVLFYYPG